MKVFKKIMSLFLTATIMINMICVGTVTAGAKEKDYSLTLNGTTEEFTITLKANSGSPLHKMYSSGSMYFVLNFICDKKNVVIICNSIKGYVATDDYGVYSSGTWQSAQTVNPKSRLTSVSYDYETHSSVPGVEGLDFKAQFTIKDTELNKLFKTCSKVELGFESYKATTFSPTLETVWTKSSTSKKNISSLTISKPSNYAYTGKNRKAAITIKDGDYTLVKGTDYTLSYKNCKNIGTATVTITGKGKYTGTKTLTYKIVPKKTTLKAEKKSNTKVKLSWTAVSGAEKYQIYYSKNGGEYKKLGTVSGSKTSVTASKLDFKKNDYKFKIRAYTKVDGKTYYSSYSSAITVK